jgi:hypothetical protein
MPHSVTGRPAQDRLGPILRVAMTLMTIGLEALVAISNKFRIRQPKDRMIINPVAMLPDDEADLLRGNA